MYLVGYVKKKYITMHSNMNVQCGNGHSGSIKCGKILD